MICTAAFLGAGPVADAFFVALRVRGLVRRLFAGGGVEAAFIPLFARQLTSGGRLAARRHAGEALSATALALLLATALLELAAPWILYGVAPGFADDPQRLGLATVLVRIMLPFVLFAAPAQFLGGMLNAAGRFAAAAMPIRPASATARSLSRSMRFSNTATLPAFGAAGGDDAEAYAGPKPLGSDPGSGLAVTLCRGPYGYYVRRGAGAGRAKLRRMSVPGGMEPEDLSLDVALAFLALPPRIGTGWAGAVQGYEHIGNGLQSVKIQAFVWIVILGVCSTSGSDKLKRRLAMRIDR